MALITMRHPNIEGSSVEVTAQAFEKAYKPKGWVAETNSPSTALDDNRDEPEPSGRFLTRKEK